MVRRGRFYEIHRLNVENDNHSSIEDFLKEEIPAISQSIIEDGIRRNKILVNSNPVGTGHIVKTGDVVTALIDRNPNLSEIEPQDIPLDILYEDEHLVVINKPAGMVVHPGPGNWSGTLVNGLTFRYKNLPTPRGGEDKPGLVHRIDKDTSGLLVTVKTEEAMKGLAKQFYDHSIERTYLALVWGDLEKDRGTIRNYLKRGEEDKRQRVVAMDGKIGKYAVTHYEVLRRFRFTNLIRCRLETGRTHQIRAHMRFLGHPLFADGLYGGAHIVYGENNPDYHAFAKKALQLMSRQTLHAKSLGFVHPITGERKQFEIELPEDFQTALNLWEEYIQKRGLEFQHG